MRSNTLTRVSNNPGAVHWRWKFKTQDVTLAVPAKFAGNLGNVRM